MNKTQKIKKFKHSKIILIFITMIFLTLFIGHLSIKSEAQGEIIKILDTNNENKRANAGMLDFLLEKHNLPKYMELGIIELKKSMNIKTLLEGCNQIANIVLVTWLLEYYYSKGYRISCVVGDWIILELIQ